MVVVESQFDKETYRDYFLFNARNGDKRLVMMGIAMAIVLLLGIFMLLSGGGIYGIILIVFCLCMPGIWAFQNRMLMKKHLELSRLDKQPIPVRFEITGKKIVTLNKNTSAYTTYPWSKILKVRETPKYFFIYINKTQAAVIRKAHIVEGSAQDVTQWAKENVKNYRNCK